MANQEEVSLDGSGPVSAPQQDVAEHQQNQINEKHGNLPLMPGASNENILDTIINAPQDTLIPWEDCYLPSRGLYYGWVDGTIQVRPMGQNADKVLATQRLAQSGQSIDYLYRECVRLPNGMAPEDLLLGDRVFILYFLRGITHGNIYEFVITCPNCENISTHSYDLNELSNTIVWAKESLGQEPFKVRLPYISKVTQKDIWVGVRFMRGFDASDILARKKSRRKMFAQPGGIKTRNARQNQPVSVMKQRDQLQTLDDTLTDNMEKIIVNVLGVEDRFRTREFINKMHSKDTAVVREWLRENTPGIDNTVSLTCPDCEHGFQMELPITESFFRPTK